MLKLLYFYPINHQIVLLTKSFPILLSKMGVALSGEYGELEIKMKTVRVVAAVICDSLLAKKRIFATAKGYGEFKGQWEFPDRKLEAGETSEQALKREVLEELDTEIVVGELIGTIEYDYATFHLSTDCFWCEVLSGELLLKEAQAARWLTKEELNDVKWLPADKVLIEKIEKEMSA